MEEGGGGGGGLRQECELPGVYTSYCGTIACMIYD